MASKVILHIGQQKSGTTYLQEVLGHVAGPLAETAGILYPASIREVLPDAVESHERATSGLLGTEYPWISAERAADERAKWPRLMARVRAWPGTALLSAEALSTIRSPAVARVAAEFAGAEVAVVVTTRSLDRSLPSLWQQHVRNGRVSTVGEFFDLLARQRDRGPAAIEREHGLHLWRAFALGGLVRRWAAQVGPERVRVVVNPGSPPDLLWRRFATAIGARHCADLPSDDVRTHRAHRGLTHVEAELVLALNRAIGEAGWSRYEGRAIREEILQHGLLPRTDRGPRVAVPMPARKRVAAWAEEDLADLRATGVRVVGNLDELQCSAEPQDVDQPPVAPEEVAQAAAAAIMAVASRDRYAPALRRRGWRARLGSRA
ncbi:hypothetical protein [Actinomadura fibrosa]|uniref:hypothetical protein n=1 Tax=Actinomadura fibrosa TaxID=111802 RepID=UPI001040F903|nr:hypothetical protein [Actinomadura fibrosa]